MKRLTLSISTPLAITLFTLAVCAQARSQDTSSNSISCRAILHQYTAPTVTLISAEIIPAGQRNPAYCKVFGTITYDIGFEVRLPVDWNGRFYMVGNEGSDGKINSRNMDNPLRLKYATASTDQGFDGNTEASTYAYNNRQKVIDYGFRATHLTAVVSKSIIETYYGTPAAYSYFVAGSAGGRQALMEAQRFPDDFDGILLSAPTYNISRIHMWGIWKAKAFSGAGHIGPEKLPALSKAIYDRCDDNDGVVDGVISDPPQCDFEPSKHLQRCNSDPTSSVCFTDEQIVALEAIYGGVKNSSGVILFPGQSLGAEAEGDMPPWMRGDGPQSAWSDSLVVPKGKQHRYLSAAESFFRYAAFDVDDPDYDWNTFDFDNDPENMINASAIVDADNPDLSAFRTSGAKMIHYHHWADTAVPPINSINYFEDVQAVTGDTEGFYKFYLVPGGFHGSQGVGATNVRWLETMVDWIENGNAPGELIASRVKNGETIFTRKICSYPHKAVYRGTGDSNLSENFDCKQ
jgi:feruloyl esterase